MVAPLPKEVSKQLKEQYEKYRWIRRHFGKWIARIIMGKYFERYYNSRRGTA